MNVSEKTDVAPEVCRVSAVAPFRWLRQGAQDLLRCPVPGLLHGLAMAAFGLLLWVAAVDHFWALVGAFSGFLLVAPVVATGLYAVSAELERGAAVSWRTVVRAWRPDRHRRMVIFGLLLALAGTGWVLTSASLITRFAPAPVNKPMDFIRHVVLADDSLLFEAWLALGAALAAPVFASSVVAIPLLMERPIGVLGAVLTSWRAVLEQPGVMALWAALIAALTLVGMATCMVGLVVLMPWLAHASWHAYRDVVVAVPGPGGVA